MRVPVSPQPAAARPARPRFTARLLFALLGAVGCLLTALLLEAVFHVTHLPAALDDRETPALLFNFYHRDETAERLQKAGAKTGDVQIALTWNNVNDLDLWCVEPSGEKIGYSHKISATQGELDVDANSGPNRTDHPVEHIVWPRGRTPRGSIRVYVNHYANHGGVDPTPFQVEVNSRGRIQKFSGMISHDFERRGDELGQFVCEINPNQAGGTVSGALPVGFWKALVVTALWAGVWGGMLAAALLGGLWLFYLRVYNRPFLALQKSGLVALYCLGWGLVAGMVAQTVYSLLPSSLLAQHPRWMHLLGFLLVGVILGGGMGGNIPHLPRRAAAIAGLLSGAIAGPLFIHIYWGGSEAWGRVLAASLIGCAIGLMIVLIVKPPAPDPEMEDYALTSMTRMRLRAESRGPAGKLRRISRK